MIFNHKQEPEFLMSEDQAVEQIEKLAGIARQSVEEGNAGEAGSMAVFTVKVARHLEWVRNYCPLLQGDGSAFIQELLKDREEARK